MANIKVLDKKIVNLVMEEKDASSQTMYQVMIPANSLTTGSKLRVTYNLSKGGGIAPPDKENFGNQLFCSDTNSQALVGISNPSEIFEPTPIFGNGTARVFHLTSSLDGNAIAGVCYKRVCCPPFQIEADRQLYLNDPQGFVSTYPDFPPGSQNQNGLYGVHNAVPGGEYGPWCTTVETWMRVDKILEGYPKFGMLVYIRPGSTVHNMTAYGYIYDHKSQKLSVRMWKNQSLLNDEGHIFHEESYNLVEGNYIYTFTDASYFSFDSTWLTLLGDIRYPYIYLSMTDDLSLNIELEWDFRHTPGGSGWFTTNTPFNTPQSNLLGPELDMYAGVCVLGENTSGSCASTVEIGDFQVECGLCYTTAALNFLEGNEKWTMIDWSCNDRVWFP